MRLYSGPMSMFGAKAHSAALEKGIDIDVVMVPYSVRQRYEPKHPDVVRINPKRQVPVLVDGDLEIFDSTQIFEYFEDLVPEPRLWPADPARRARARQLEHCSDEVFFPHIIRLMGARTGLTPTRRTPQKALQLPTIDRWMRSWTDVITSRATSVMPISPSTWPSSSARYSEFP